MGTVAKPLLVAGFNGTLRAIPLSIRFTVDTCDVQKNSDLEPDFISGIPTADLEPRKTFLAGLALNTLQSEYEQVELVFGVWVVLRIGELVDFVAERTRTVRHNAIMNTDDGICLSRHRGAKQLV